MENKSNKELAIETALEYTKSWNSAEHTQKISTSDFIKVINAVYDAICSLDKR